MIKIIQVCTGGSCKALGSEKLVEEFNRIIRAENIQNLEVRMYSKKTGCHGLCELGPIVVIKPDEVFYTKVQLSDVKDIVDAIKNNSVVERLFYESKAKVNDHAFYNKQKRYLLRRVGEIDPEDVNDFLLSGGFQGIKKALTFQPEEVISLVKESGLRGRGGGGFSTGLKWSFLAKESGNKVLIANGDEGDPGSFMDRTLMEGDPFSIIEGMLIASYATNAKKAYIYVRAEYPDSIEILNNAINICYERGYLGKDLFGKKGFDLDLKTFLGAGAYVCGEETALIHSIEGRRGMPKQKPPFPSHKGLNSMPTNINNVKTYAYVSHIMRDGMDSFKKIGTEKSPGTAVLCLTGKVKHTGIVEVPMGMPLKELIYDIGGGLKSNKNLKAVLTGGPSGGAIPVSKIDTGVDFDSLSALGTIMGSGGILVLDEDDSMPEVAEFFLEFNKDESCGKCVPCREGTHRLHEILERINKGKAKEEDLIELENLSKYVKDTSLCGLGQAAPNPILSSLKYFKEEFEEKIPGKNKLPIYEIHDNCIGCHQCFLKCPVHTIIGEPGKQHMILQDNCIHCGACFRVCPVGAISQKFKLKDNIAKKEGNQDD